MAKAKARPSQARRRKIVISKSIQKSRKSSSEKIEEDSSEKEACC